MEKIFEICTVENCDKKKFRKGFCHKHYTRFNRYGSTDIVNNRGIKKGSIKGISHWRYGKKLSEEHKKILKESRLGNKHTGEAKRKISQSMKGHKHSEETKRKISLANKGKKYKQINRKIYNNRLRSYLGITPLTKVIRQCDKYKQWRTDIFIRDNFTCKKCNQRGVRLEAHHIKSFKKLILEIKEYMPLLNLYDASILYPPLWDINNGITLCKSCHYKIYKKS